MERLKGWDDDGEETYIEVDDNRVEIEKIFTACLEDDRKSIKFIEECDRWFVVRMKKKDLGVVIAGLVKMHHRMEE